MTVGIVGLGLIGGSMAKSIKARTAHTVFGCDLDQETMMMARMCGAIDAPLVGVLAIMERSYVSWGDDLIPVHREMDFVKAYLLLQKYRFGDRLNYELEIEDDCVDIEIPKLTIVTFVENACLHGVERKAANGWIFVRAYREGDSLALEVEDTGEGMNEELQNAINKQLEEVSLENMKGKKHVGMMNACMRLKLLTKGRARYRLESEEGVGTVMHITIPIDK